MAYDVSMEETAHGHFFPAVDFGRDDVPELDALMAALQKEGPRVVPVRYLGGTAWEENAVCP